VVGVEAGTRARAEHLVSREQSELVDFAEMPAAPPSVAAESTCRRERWPTISFRVSNTDYQP
jgi:hypothetical protein